MKLLTSVKVTAVEEAEIEKVDLGSAFIPGYVPKYLKVWTIKLKSIMALGLDDPGSVQVDCAIKTTNPATAAKFKVGEFVLIEVPEPVNPRRSAKVADVEG